MFHAPDRAARVRSLIIGISSLTFISVAVIRLVIKRGHLTSNNRRCVFFTYITDEMSETGTLRRVPRANESIRTRVIGFSLLLLVACPRLKTRQQQMLDLCYALST